MRKISRTMLAVAAGAAALAMTAATSFAASHYEGTWHVKDTEGTPFDIILSGDGKANAHLRGEEKIGTWSEKDGAVLIVWKDGWHSQIAKHGSGYMKKSWDEKKTMDDAPTNSSDATKK
jgi:hypothetical protein